MRKKRKRRSKHPLPNTHNKQTPNPKPNPQHRQRSRTTKMPIQKRPNRRLHNRRNSHHPRSQSPLRRPPLRHNKRNKTNMDMKQRLSDDIVGSRATDPKATPIPKTQSQNQTVSVQLIMITKIFLSVFNREKKMKKKQKIILTPPSLRQTLHNPNLLHAHSSANFPHKPSTELKPSYLTQKLTRNNHNKQQTNHPQKPTNPTQNKPKNNPNPPNNP